MAKNVKTAKKVKTVPPSRHELDCAEERLELWRKFYRVQRRLLTCTNELHNDVNWAAQMYGDSPPAGENARDDLFDEAQKILFAATGIRNPYHAASVIRDMQNSKKEMDMAEAHLLRLQHLDGGGT